MKPTREEALFALAVAKQIAGRPQLYTANAMATARPARTCKYVRAT